MNMNIERTKQNTTELVILSPAATADRRTKTQGRGREGYAGPAAAAAAHRAEIDFVPEELPVITAPVRRSYPAPEPIQVAPSPAPVSQTRPG